MSYKQDESPRYHARVVAEKIARVHGAVLLLGSATPSLESYFRAAQGELTLLVMPRRIGDIPLPVIQSKNPGIKVVWMAMAGKDQQGA